MVTPPFVRCLFDSSIRHKEVAKEPVKPTEEKPELKKDVPKLVPTKPEKRKVSSPSRVKAISWRKVGGIAGILAVIALFTWGGISLWDNLSSNTPELGQATEEPLAPTKEPALGVGSTMTGKDGMILLYVPAGEFTTGSEEGADDENPFTQFISRASGSTKLK